MQAQDGVKTILLSGLRASVMMEDGKKLDEAKVKEAVAAKGLTFVSMEETKMAAPKASYVLQAAGTG